MNYKANLNYTARLFALVITIAFVGLSGVQAHDSEHPHDHRPGEDNSNPPPPDPLTDDNDADSPEDFWGPPPGTSATPEVNIDDEEIPLNDFGFPICPDGFEPTLSDHDITVPGSGVWTCEETKTVEEILEELEESAQQMYDTVCAQVEQGSLEVSAIAGACSLGCIYLIKPSTPLGEAAVVACTAACTYEVNKCL